MLVGFVFFLVQQNFSSSSSNKDNERNTQNPENNNNFFSPNDYNNQPQTEQESFHQEQINRKIKEINKKGPNREDNPSIPEQKSPNKQTQQEQKQAKKKCLEYWNWVPPTNSIDRTMSYLTLYFTCKKRKNYANASEIIQDYNNEWEKFFYQYKEEICDSFPTNAKEFREKLFEKAIKNVRRIIESSSEINDNLDWTEIWKIMEKNIMVSDCFPLHEPLGNEAGIKAIENFTKKNNGELQELLKSYPEIDNATNVSKQTTQQFNQWIKKYLKFYLLGKYWADNWGIIRNYKLKKSRFYGNKYIILNFDDGSKTDIITSFDL